MQISDLGDEAIDEILAEAVDGMKRRTGKAWTLELDGEQDRLRVILDGRTLTRTYVTVHLPEVAKGDAAAPEAIRFRSALRRNILDVTQALSPVPDAANIPAAMLQTFGAIQTLDRLGTRGDAGSLGPIRHDLYRILDHLTGNDHSGCSGAPSVADYGLVVPLVPKPKRDVPIEADIAAVRDALREAEATTDLDDVDGMTHVRALRDSLDGLLAEQRRGA